MQSGYTKTDEVWSLRGRNTKIMSRWIVIPIALVVVVLWLYLAFDEIKEALF